MPQVSIVWPHDGHGERVPLAEANAVNISVWPRNVVSCNQRSPTVTLWRAEGNEPAEEVDIRGEWLVRQTAAAAFPSLEFNDVPADTQGSPARRYVFFAGFASNVWVHSADARTLLPEPVLPTGIAEQESLRQLDTRIQIVWPHDGRGNPAPVAEARAVNIAVDIFLHGTRRSVPTKFAPSGSDTMQPVLYVAEGNGMMTWVRDDSLIATAERSDYTVEGQRFPRWVFNNVPVSPGAQYHFLAVVRGDSLTYPSVWTHAQSPLTELPNPAPPPQAEDCR